MMRAAAFGSSVAVVGAAIGVPGTVGDGAWSMVDGACCVADGSTRVTWAASGLGDGKSTKIPRPGGPKLRDSLRPRPSNSGIDAKVASRRRQDLDGPEGNGGVTFAASVSS